MARTMVQYEKVLEVLKAADGEPVMLEELKEKCEAAGVYICLLYTSDAADE